MAAKPREVSSSDAESDSESELVQEKRKRKRQHTKYQCPADFVVCDFRPCASTRLENVNDGDKELWLIKAPLTFNPDSFSGIRVPTMGLGTIQPGTRQKQVYSVLSRPVAAGDARLLTTTSQRSRDTLCAPGFSGIINISESYGDCQGNQAPAVIPACPAPVIPEGLRQRFRPFGSRTASSRGSGPRARRPEEEGGLADGPTEAERAKTVPEESETPKKKKKKKKDKRVKVEKEEMVEEEVSARASQGLTQTSQDSPQETGPEEEAVEKRKKKKKSKDRDREATEGTGGGVEVGLSLKEEVEVKSEPLDVAYGDVESSVKKKKAKKEKRQTLD